MRHSFPLLALLAACAVDGDELDPDLPLAGSWEDALQAADPVWVVDLVDDPTAFFPADPDCPSFERSDDAELWLGGCVQADGTLIEGSLQRRVGDDASWVAADGFSASRDGALLVALDGAVEMVADGDLLLVEAAMSACADGVADCTLGSVAFDLDWTVLVGPDWPDSYDATVSGFFAASGSPIAAVQGAWSMDRATCATEPLEGSFGFRQGDRHTLSVDGASACDGCAAWHVQGVGVPAYCGLPL
jgi:hypothetical protein